MHYQILVELDQNLQPNLHTIYNELYHSFLDEFLGQYSSTLQEDVAILQTVIETSNSIFWISFVPHKSIKSTLRYRSSNEVIKNKSFLSN